MATRGQKIAAGLAVTGAVAFVLWPRRASAAPSAALPSERPLPSGGTVFTYPTPPDNMPWNRFSAETLRRQKQYNALAAADTFYGFPLITEDGILGPETCKALGDYIFYLTANAPNAPMACVDISWQTARAI